MDFQVRPRPRRRGLEKSEEEDDDENEHTRPVMFKPMISTKHIEHPILDARIGPARCEQVVRQSNCVVIRLVEQSTPSPKK